MNPYIYKLAQAERVNDRLSEVARHRLVKEAQNKKRSESPFKTTIVRLLERWNHWSLKRFSLLLITKRHTKPVD